MKSMRFFPILLVMMLFHASIHAQSMCSINGVLMDGDKPVAFANVVLLGTDQGTVSDPDGRFRFSELPAGMYQLRASAVGFKTLVREVELNQAEFDVGVLQMQTDIFGLEEVVVSASMKESYVTASPVRVEVVTSELMERTSNPVNLVQALRTLNGVQEVVSCGVCYTNSISINGLPGQYTAILVDGSPIYGNLASVYGLNGIPRQMIERIEVTKGPNSTLYGSEAMAGVINIVTKSPADQPLVAADLRVSSHLETFGNVAWSPSIGNWNISVGVNYGFMNQFFDENADGFGDIVGMDRLSAFSKWTLKRKKNKRFQFMTRYYYENRWNGVQAFFQNRNYRDLRGNDSIYGESIYTHRGELFGSYELPTKPSIRLDFSSSYHAQDSYYGIQQYVAKQMTGYANLLWNRRLGRHELTAGTTFRYQYYDDNTEATRTESEHQYIPGIFLQDEWGVVLKKLTCLTGVRLDYYSVHGPVFSPRLSVKWKPSVWSTFRTNLGTGFKVVNLFTEDHAFVSGQREVVILDQLKPERSYNASLSFNQVYVIGNSQGTIDADAYFTFFTNRIIADYETDAQRIIYANTKGYARSWGIGLSVSQSFVFPLDIRFGFNYMNATETEDGRTQRILFAPEYSGNATITYTWRKINLNVSYTSNLYGPMRLPEVYDIDPVSGIPESTPRPTRSKPYYLDVFQLTYNWNRFNLRLFIGVENIAGYVQPISPLVAFNDPGSPIGFSPYFDTSYSYSPVHGREFYGGIAWQLN